MFGRKKVKDTDNDLAVVYVGLDNAHSTMAPGREEYPSPPTYGLQPFAPRLGTTLPSIPNQDAILTHWYRPPDGANPTEWWDDNNDDELTRDKQQQFTTRGWQSETHKIALEDNPWLAGAPLPRVTSEMSPSNYRHLRPYDVEAGERTLNGNHASMASMKRSYPVNGMTPARSLRNTFRLEPSPRDLENIDLSQTEVAAPTPAVFVSPAAVSGNRWSL